MKYLIILTLVISYSCNKEKIKTDKKKKEIKVIKAIDQNVIKIATGDYPPYNNNENPNKGCAIHLLKSALESQGKKVKIDFLPWKRAYLLAKKGQYDITSQWLPRPDRKVDLIFPKVAIHNEVALFYSLKENNFNWGNFEDLKGKVIGIVRGFTYSEEFFDAVKKYNLKTVVVNKDIQNIKKLLKGRIDITILNPNVFKVLTKEFTPEEKGKLTSHSKPLLKNLVYPLFSRKKGAKQLIKIYERGMKKIKDRVDLKESYSTCFSGS